MKAVLLAAGHGTRLQPLTDDTPKILMNIGGETLLEKQLRYLAGEGVDEVLVNAHHHADQVVAAVKGWTIPRVRVFVEEELLGTAGALIGMRDALPRRFVVLNGDTLTGQPLYQMVNRLSAGHDAVVAVKHMLDTRGKGVAFVIGGRIVDFKEKPVTHYSGFVNTGVYAMNERVLDWIKPGDDIARDLFPQLAADGRLFPHFTDSSFLDVGTPAGLEAAAKW